jgi:hypothetical protein
VEGIQLRAVVNTVMNLRVPLQAVNFFKSWVTTGLSRTAPYSFSCTRKQAYELTS